ncbi:MAG: hypothetical protein WCK16_02425 [Candidatus Moraniibacteriota bacterium]
MNKFENSSNHQEIKEIKKEKLGIYFKNFPSFQMDVIIKNEKVLEVLSDVDADGFISYGKYAFEETLAPLINAGVEVYYEPWTTSDDEYADDIEGRIFIKKESINKAIAEGRITIYKNEDGELVIE